MFENLSERFSRIVNSLSGKGRLTDENIKETISEVRMALLEADVALPVVKTVVEQIRTQALGTEVTTRLTPGQALIQIVHQELVRMMGEENATLNLNTAPPAIILMAGLQGSGKTTTTAKLAKHLKEQQHKSVLVVSTDIYRPAAIDQLATLAREVGVAFFPSTPTEQPVAIATAAIKEARQQAIDVVIVDTAGRLHIDTEMMAEIKAIHHAINPIETLFVVDSMTGQDAANTAKVFHESLALTGIILTKADGDSRGGAALSIRSITGKPIKFIGTGEKTAALDPFYPERIASRILGMGDVLSLIEAVQRKVDHTKTEKLAKKIKKGKSFDLEDFKEQLSQLAHMGSMSELLDKLPGLGQMKEVAKAQLTDKSFNQTIAIINSMTIQERRFPNLIRGSRKKRIAIGSGTQIPDVNRLLKQFTQMQKMMQKMSKKGGMTKMMRGLQGMLGQEGFPRS